MTERSEVPRDLIDLREAVRLLGPDPVGIAGLVAAEQLTEYRVGGVPWFSRQQLIDHRFRSAGLIPAAEWAAPDSEY
ncbi:hypothetical protein [Mycolicibacterium mageritense]|uniref:hypothetical protein n=1 Tax=Mycolicibacterium mageritense TaxID=53462 RepID=UPI0011D70E50|nr:hypothetical protein [Mycolicibacterium mageritense]TXI62480.1 MAG: hypothetical protein E6Q55_12720 [Mycolicibacterium mageritense]